MLAPTGGGRLIQKPLPRKKIANRFSSLARGHTELCIKVLAGSQPRGRAAGRARVGGRHPAGSWLGTRTVTLRATRWGASPPTRQD